ncbi:Hypothetical protein CINCED_3A008478 [Cinara cedri]|uniref:Uncharacterized protein n=1 Tax=Cinara cedri TaxID=506608 RepID=A0A5E4N312_9HEMI|nr:Hypothetical protein CINCED_3A008478 [Cinara cedri]
MTFTDTIVYIGERVGNISNKHSKINNKIQNKKIWKSLRNHIISRRKKNKQAEIQAEKNAEILRKKKILENQQIQENKLSLAQINGRLTELHDRRNELQQEKQALLSQTVISNMMNFAVPRTGLKCGQFEDISKQITGTISSVASATTLLQKQLNLFDMLTIRIRIERLPMFIDGFNSIAQYSVIIPSKINGTDKQSFWIIYSLH